VRVRVYEMAKRLGVPSQILLVHLRSRAVDVNSASSPLAESEISELLTTHRAVEVKAVAVEQERQATARRTTHWWDDDDADWEYARPTWVGPSTLSTADAGRAVGVSAATIRQWVVRGYLTPVGRQGRSHLFTASDVIKVDRLTRSRVLDPVQSPESIRRIFGGDTRRGVSGANLQELVTAAEAARSAGVSETTIRSWVHRGLLRPAGRRGRSNLFVRRDVIKLARRSPNRPQRKPRHP